MSINSCFLTTVRIMLCAGLTLLVLFFSNNTKAECNDSIPRSTPNQAFTIHGDGTVTHKTTGLMWMRCLIGQLWDGITCSGTEQEYTWQSALQVGNDDFIFAGYNDWRLPNKNELASIVELACFSPAINSTVFPDTNQIFNPATSRTVWTSTPMPDNTFSFRATQAWTVRFYGGDVITHDRSHTMPVRLVRGGQ